MRNNDTIKKIIEKVDCIHFSTEVYRFMLQESPSKYPPDFIEKATNLFTYIEQGLWYAIETIGFREQEIEKGKRLERPFCTIRHTIWNAIIECYLFEGASWAIGVMAGEDFENVDHLSSVNRFRDHVLSLINDLFEMRSLMDKYNSEAFRAIGRGLTFKVTEPTTDQVGEGQKQHKPNKGTQK